MVEVWLCNVPEYPVLHFFGEPLRPPPFDNPQGSTLNREAEHHPVIAIIEDNPADVFLVREALREHNVACTLIELRDGEQALRFVTDVESGLIPSPALIVLDMNLPKKNGREVLMRLRANDVWAATPVVVLSSSGAQQDLDVASQLGAARYIRKPLDLEEFMSIGAILKGILDGPQA